MGGGGKRLRGSSQAFPLSPQHSETELKIFLNRKHIFRDSFFLSCKIPSFIFFFHEPNITR